MIGIRHRVAVAACVGGLLVGAGPAPAFAGGSRAPADPAFVSECGSCHVPYPAKLLSAGAWRTVMNNLDRHFGSDASIDAAIAQKISAYLEANAGTGSKVSTDPALIRVTQSPRFERKHREIPAATWKSEKVQSAANCGACHASAQDGRFSDHDARIPR
jgi:nitrate/TMAO reductase-like tetraheme cytochrome c subunit